MKMLNALDAVPADAAGRAGLMREGLSILIRALYPVIPHTGCALWDELGFAGQFGPLLDAPWPQVDAAALAQDEIELVLQVNGTMLRGKLKVSRRKRWQGHRGGGARESPKSGKSHGRRRHQAVIVVPGKLVNVVA
jgi:leucyl-tRNA synthetase